MQKKQNFSVAKNQKIAKKVYRMILHGDEAFESLPGQFLNVLVDGFFLRRPISICDFNGCDITIVYKIMGRGTEAMSKFRVGHKLDILTGLGNGYTLVNAKKPLLVGGGVGVPPLYLLAKELVKVGQTPSVVLGFLSKKDVFFENEFNALGLKTIIATNDGKYGVKGLATEVMRSVDYDYFYASGPIPMLRATALASAEIDGQLSLEEHMGCGFGACMGCSCKTKYGNKRICMEGPVLKKDEIIW